ncbi:hypothetical protein BDW59DRAFT_145648 [Aspergillus cavernicola]|uniref:ABM domain-containing protein n=1 Tax=Aspergillus cavernicola TaxID=176166 RepID=A0ABR4IDX2_9EURO
MPTPVTEIVILSFLPNSQLEDPIHSAHTILQRQDGFLRFKWGRWEEDQDKVQLFINWKDITHHQAFIASGAEYTALLATVSAILTQPPEIIHVHFALGHETINKILDDPVVELATFYAVGEGFEEAVDRTLAVGAKSEGCLGYVRGGVVEELEFGDKKEKGKGHFAAISWTSVQARLEATKREDVREAGGVIIGRIGGYEVHHVRFR